MAEEDFTADIAHNGESVHLEQSEVQQLRQEINYLVNQLRFDAKAKGMIAGSLLGYAFGNGFEQRLAFMIAGGVLGAKLPIKELTEEDKAKYLGAIRAKNERMNYLIALERGQDINRNPAKMSMDGLDGLIHEYYHFSPRWQNFIGNPVKNFHAMISGRPKQGKSILAIQLADELSKHGRTLYIASEEGLGATLKQKVQDFAPGDNSNMEFANWKNFAEIMEGFKEDTGYSFVVIDSINYARLSVQDIEDFKNAFPGTALITIHQATKDGNFRGSQEYAHNCDIVISVEAGIATQEGRFAAPAALKVFDN
jgi:hypothetical protein